MLKESIDELIAKRIELRREESFKERESTTQAMDLNSQAIQVETDIDNQYLMAKLNDDQRREAATFEEGKDALNGLHFISVQVDENSDPAGFWLLREIPENL